jgi:hypothetical protein
MTVRQPAQRAVNVAHALGAACGGPRHHHHRQSECARSVQLRLSCIAAGILGDNDPDPAFEEQAPLVVFEKGSARG